MEILKDEDKNRLNAMCQWWMWKTPYGNWTNLDFDKKKGITIPESENTSSTLKNNLPCLTGTAGSYDSGDWFSKKGFEYSIEKNVYFDQQYPEMSEEELFFREICEFGNDGSIENSYEEIRQAIEAYEEEE